MGEASSDLRYTRRSGGRDRDAVALEPVKLPNCSTTRTQMSARRYVEAESPRTAVYVSAVGGSESCHPAARRVLVHAVVLQQQTCRCTRRAIGHALRGTRPSRPRAAAAAAPPRRIAFLVWRVEAGDRSCGEVLYQGCGRLYDGDTAVTVRVYGVFEAAVSVSDAIKSRMTDTGSQKEFCTSEDTFSPRQPSQQPYRVLYRVPSGPGPGLP